MDCTALPLQAKLNRVTGHLGTSLVGDMAFPFLPPCPSCRVPWLDHSISVHMNHTFQVCRRTMSTVPEWKDSACRVCPVLLCSPRAASCFPSVQAGPFWSYEPSAGVQPTSPFLAQGGQRALSCSHAFLKPS